MLLITNIKHNFLLTCISLYCTACPS